MDDSPPPPPPPMTTITTTMADTDSPLTVDEKQQQQHEDNSAKNSTTNNNNMPITRKKKGVKPGTKMNMEKTRSDWYHACKTYRRLRHSRNNNKNNMSQIDFLKDPISGPKFRGTQSEQSSFGKYLRQYDAGQLSASQHGKRAKVARYPDVEARLVDFIHSEYRPDECLWSWTFLQKKALEFAQELGYPDHSFHASNGWICNVLKRGNKTGFELHHLEPEQQEHDDHQQDNQHQEDGTNNNKLRHNRQASRLVATLIASQRQQQAPSVVVPGETTTSPMPSLSGDDDDDDDVDDEDQLLLREALATATKQSSPPMHHHHHHHHDNDNDDTHKTSPILIKPWRCICNEENDAELNYCGMCGTPQRWQCLTCQFANNRARFKFCGMCGILKQPQPQQQHHQHQQHAPPPPVGGGV